MHTNENVKEYENEWNNENFRSSRDNRISYWIVSAHNETK